MGTVINALAIVVASIVGVLFKRGLPEKLQKSAMFVLGLSLAVLSVGWFLRDFLMIDGDGETLELLSSGDLLIILSLVLGTLIGEAIGIDEGLTRFAHGIEKKYDLPPLAKGFVSGTLIFCVGAMAILGPIDDGLHGDMTVLLVKSALDFVTAMMLAAVLGIGVLFAAFSVLIYQGTITILAAQFGVLLTDEMIRALSMVGNIILVAMGFNFMGITKTRVANMLPALLVPIVYFVIRGFFG